MLSDPLAQDLYAEFCRIPAIDSYTQLDPRQPASRSLDDLLSQHGFPELALATGMDQTMLAPGVDPEDRIRALFYHLVDFFPNTVLYQWFSEIAHAFLGFQGERLSFADCTQLYTAAGRLMGGPAWEQRVLDTCNLEKLFVSLPFDDALAGFDTRRYIPCLAADDLVFRLEDPSVRRRLARATGFDLDDTTRLHQALAARLEYFERHGARAITLAVPLGFAPLPVEEAGLSHVLTTLARGHELDDGGCRLCAHGVFRALVETCQAFRLPLELMVGMPPRGAGEAGRVVKRFDHPTPLVHYHDVFRSAPTVTFCVSEISPSLREELSYASTEFANVFSNGHGGAANNVPVALSRALRERLQVIPQVKQVGYFTGMDKLEFGLPLFNMYRRALADVLATEFVRPRIYTLWQAVALGRLLLRDNARRVFDL